MRSALTGAEDYRTAQELLGLEPFHSSRLATFTARLRQHGILEPVTAAICQLARKLDEHGAPIDYARRRRLRRFSQAQLDTAAWRRQRYFLTHPATWAQRRHLDHASPPAAPVQEQFARLRLIDLLTGTHPRYLPGPLRLPERRHQEYTQFAFTMPEQMAFSLHQQARALPSKASISEPVTWEPPFDWAVGIEVRHPHQPGPPARDRHRHRPAAHRARRETHADRLRPALRPRRPSRPGVTRAIPEPDHQTRTVTTAAAWSWACRRRCASCAA